MSRLIVGLTGETGVGKTTLGNYLAMANCFQHIAFADQNRKEVAEHWGFDVRWFDAYPFKDTAFDWLCVANCKVPEFIEWFGKHTESFYRYEACTPRRLQLLWSDYIKSIRGENYYIDIVEREIVKYPNRNFVISDIRSELEAQFVHSLGDNDKCKVGIFDVLGSKDIYKTKPDHALHKPIPRELINAHLLNTSSPFEFAQQTKCVFREFFGYAWSSRA